MFHGSHDGCLFEKHLGLPRAEEPELPEGARLADAAETEAVSDRRSRGRARGRLGAGVGGGKSYTVRVSIQ